MVLATAPIDNIGTNLNGTPAITISGINTHTNTHPTTTPTTTSTTTTTTTTVSTNAQPSSPSSSSSSLSSSSPPNKTKRSRSDGCSRINGSLSLNDIIKSLIKRRQNGQFKEKPPYSYAILICLAILQSDDGKLTLSQIYHWISSHFPFFQLKDSSWQNSIRHNLSLNDGFIKTVKSSDGKGHFWQVKETSAQKFFKHETRSYEEIRDELKDLDHYIFATGDTTTTTTTTISNDPMDLNDSTTFIENHPIPVSNNSLKDPLTINLPKISIENNQNHNHNCNDAMYNFDNDDQTLLIQISSPPQYNNNDSNNDNDNNSNNFIGKFESESSPNQRLTNKKNRTSSNLNTIKRSQTALGLQSSNYKNTTVRTPILQNSAIFHGTFTPIQDQSPNQLMFNNNLNNTATFNNNHPFSLSFSSNSTSSTQISPNNNFKKYFCSFNSNFDISPSRNENDNNLNKNVQESNNSFNVKTNSSQLSTNHQLELFKTPELRRSQSFESVSRQIFNTPRYEQLNDYYKINHVTTSTTNATNNNKDDQNKNTNNENHDNITLNNNNTSKNNATDLLMKNWKTPSHLFEDIYSSPILKAMGKTPITKISSTPNGTIIKTFSPRNLSTPNLFGNYTPTTTTTTTIKTKLSSGGLFGVDVYSVWERALKDFDPSKYKNSNNDIVNPNSKNEKLDLPFMSQSQITKSPQNRF
ncbi:Hcm1p PWA37_004679 [Arxiozyma heterogenica]|uniref:Hcm1p n=1 Tax=Arxiozyma heterogenica TaxID=278026 RepID=UPI002F240B31